MTKNKLNWEMYSKYDNYVFDLDGTLYLGGIIIPGADIMFNKLVQMKKNVMVMTNNSSNSPSEYAKRLRNLGFECNDDMVINSTTATINYLN